jgi:hypothetical protein
MFEPHCLNNGGSEADLYFRPASSLSRNGFVGIASIHQFGPRLLARREPPETVGARITNPNRPFFDALVSPSTSFQPSCAIFCVHGDTAATHTENRQESAQTAASILAGCLARASRKDRRPPAAARRGTPAASRQSRAALSEQELSASGFARRSSPDLTAKSAAVRNRSGHGRSTRYSRSVQAGVHWVPKQILSDVRTDHE